MDEDMFSANDEEESSEDPYRGLGRWFMVVQHKKRRFDKPGKAGAMENVSLKLRTICQDLNSCELIVS